MSEGQFLVPPDTSEYVTVGFLVARCGERFTLDEIAAHTDRCETEVTSAVADLVERGLLEQAASGYYLDPDRAEEIRHRLRSLDAACQLFATAPTDDAYAEPGWTDEVPSLDVDEDSGP